MNRVAINSAGYPGKGKVYEDYFWCEILPSGETIVILADGMGGLEHGDWAAKITVHAVFDEIKTYIGKLPPEDLLHAAFGKADSAVMSECHKHRCKMGAAVTALIITEGTLYYIWQGNVRLYITSEDGSFELLTKDHVTNSEGNENTFLTRSINGKGFRESPPTGMLPLNSPVILYLCTDGFYQTGFCDNLKTFIKNKILDGLIDDASVIQVIYK
ncbi:PP2C family protein-serine/threonine phosphatase [Parabacteroides pacaensis]|uniref:PP2C family protein-serine/threonine phosphatase n=1 Tax=Parabacteroides pacaensis TaxID=2086575 RepID=UPI000D10ED24|nr:protein phosphatase 2C domain-containing protein [Parabacteroides pacaensis]